MIAELEAEAATETGIPDIGKNLDNFRKEARMTVEQLAAAATNGDAKAVRQHIRGERKMRPRAQQDYETVLTKKLGRPIRLDESD